jgi:hypothetical protein
MNRVATSLLGIWLGGMAAITFTATRAFQTFDKEVAGNFMGGLFKTVDLFGVVAASRGVGWRSVVHSGRHDS